MSGPLPHPATLILPPGHFQLMQMTAILWPNMPIQSRPEWPGRPGVGLKWGAWRPQVGEEAWVSPPVSSGSHGCKSLSYFPKGSRVPHTRWTKTATLHTCTLQASIGISGGDPCPGSDGIPVPDPSQIFFSSTRPVPTRKLKMTGYRVIEFHLESNKT